MKKRFIAIVLAVLLVVLGVALVGCDDKKGGEGDTTTGETEAPVTEGTLTVGFDASFPPMGFFRRSRRLYRL